MFLDLRTKKKKRKRIKEREKERKEREGETERNGDGRELKWEKKDLERKEEYVHRGIHFPAKTCFLGQI